MGGGEALKYEQKVLILIEKQRGTRSNGERRGGETRMKREIMRREKQTDSLVMKSVPSFGRHGDEEDDQVKY